MCVSVSQNATARDHRHARSSADDPTISSTRSSKHVSSNARTHPRAELRDSATPHKGGKTNQGQQLYMIIKMIIIIPCGRGSVTGSPLSANHVSNETNGGRKRPCEVYNNSSSSSITSATIHNLLFSRVRMRWKGVCGWSTRARRDESTTTTRRTACRSGRGLLACPRGRHIYSIACV